MLHHFLTSNRNVLIARCKDNAAKRAGASAAPAGVDHGVPIFLQQLVETLRSEEPVRAGATPRTQDYSAIRRTAALHGVDLLNRGYTIDQVVRDYGDVCQTITGLAREQHALITVAEFQTLNRCLDNAIADAVTSFGSCRDLSQADSDAQLKRFGYMANEQRRVLDMAIQSYAAIKTGNIGLNGETGAVLENALREARALVDQVLASPVPRLRD